MNNKHECTMDQEL